MKSSFKKLPEIIITKRFILDVAAILDPPLVAIIAVINMRCYKMHRFLLQNAASFYHKPLENLTQGTAATLLQNVSVLLQNAAILQNQYSKILFIV